VGWEFLPRGDATHVRYAYRGVRPNSEYTAAAFASGRSLRLHAAAMRDDAFACMRRVLEAPGADVTGGDLFDALLTQRAVRRFRPEPIADAVLRQILAAATRAPSARNAQPWAFVAVRDAATRAAIGRVYLAAWRRAQAFIAASDADADIRDRPNYAPMMRAVDHLAAHLEAAPVLVLCGLDRTALGPMADASGTILAPASAYASIFPAVQNLMLAARGLGVGSTLTTLLYSAEDELRALVGRPPHIHIAALVPLGYPTRPFRLTTRRPLDEVAFLDRWGNRLG
jgi:nitroreductase